MWANLRSPLRHATPTSPDRLSLLTAPGRGVRARPQVVTSWLGAFSLLGHLGKGNQEQTTHSAPFEETAPFSANHGTRTGCVPSVSKKLWEEEAVTYRRFGHVHPRNDGSEPQPPLVSLQKQNLAHIWGSQKSIVSDSYLQCKYIHIYIYIYIYGPVFRVATPKKMLKRLVLRGCLLMVPCSGFYVHLKTINHLLRCFLAVFGSLYIVVAKVIIWVNCRLVHCWAGGWHCFHLKEVVLLVVIMFWGVGGAFVLTSCLSLKVCYKLNL